MSEEKTLSNYYKFHAYIYDSTRWTFLFGRQGLIKKIKKQNIRPNTILEIGCGTGNVTKALTTHFPDAHILSLDLSEDMLHIARKKLKDHNNVNFMLKAFDAQFQYKHSFDLIIYAYSLSMIREQWDSLEKATMANLSPMGHIGLVDFHNSSASWFKKWMGYNHVYMEGHLPSWMNENFDPVQDDVQKAYLGWWVYRSWIGRKL